jgi:hypothetical protein
MLQNNGMKNRYRDLIPLEFIISIIESINRKVIFNNMMFINGDNYLMKIKQNYNFNSAQNPFWLILYLKEQVYLPLSYIFNEYYIIYSSLSKDSHQKIFNNNNNINNINDLRSNRANNINNDNLSFYTFNSNNTSVMNNSSYEEFGMVFDGNLNGDLNKKMTKDAKFYCLFLLLGILKLWINKLLHIIDSNNYLFESKKSTQDELDLKQFNLEIKKNGNQKIKNVLNDYFEELKQCKLFFSEQKYENLINYGENIRDSLKNMEERILDLYSSSEENSFEDDRPNNNDNKVLKINVIGEQNIINNRAPFSYSRSGNIKDLMK